MRCFEEDTHGIGEGRLPRHRDAGDQAVAVVAAPEYCTTVRNDGLKWIGLYGIRVYGPRFDGNLVPDAILFHCCPSQGALPPNAGWASLSSPQRSHSS